jgi:uncharacterized protein YcbK (DUF882 family)
MVRNCLEAGHGNVSRRRILQAAVAVPAIWIAGQARADEPSYRPDAVDSPGLPSRFLSLTNTHTGESQQVQYRSAAGYLPEGLRRLELLLRDHRSGESHPIDPRLFDMLHRLAEQSGADPRFEVISGYRSPASNAMLSANSSGVARNSLHVLGKAIDVRLVGVSCARLRDHALAMRQGGVGYYGKSGFVHLDTGRVRSWSG